MPRRLLLSTVFSVSKFRIIRRETPSKHKSRKNLHPGSSRSIPCPGVVPKMKLLIQIVLWQGVLAILLFVPAGTINWTGAWIFLIETFVVSVVLGLWLARHDPALLKERLRLPLQKGQSIQDKIVTGVLVLLYFGWFAFMA